MQKIAPLSPNDPARQQPAAPVSSVAPVPSPTPVVPATPAPAHSHELTRDEVLELGLLAVEEPHEVPAVPATGIPPAAPLPPAAVVSPEPAQPTAPIPEVVHEASGSAAPLPQSAMAAPATPPPTTEAPAQPAKPEVMAPQATPTKAPDVAPLLPAEPAPVIQAEEAETVEAVPTSVAATPAVASRGTVDPTIGVSANTQSLKSISRLHAVGVVMNIIVIVLILAIIAGGWMLYNRLTNGAVSVF